MAREAMDVCLRVLKESNKSRFDRYSVRNSILIPYHLSGFTCTYFATTYLEIALVNYATDQRRERLHKY